MGAERKKKAGPHCPPPSWQLSRLVGAAELDRQEEHSPKCCAPDAPPPAGLLSSAVTTESGYDMVFSLSLYVHFLPVVHLRNTAKQCFK